MSSTLRGRVALTFSLFALVGLSSEQASGQNEAESLSASFRKAASRVLPAVAMVHPVGNIIRVPRLPEPVPFEIAPPRAAGGSGIVIDADKGFVLTNDHIVEGARVVEVILHDGRRRMASQIRRDPRSDLALIVLDGKAASQVEWGDSESLETGDWVLAIGQPLGLPDTVTAGIVSGKGRGLGMAIYHDLIQTDALITPGNSGGPLVNMKGEVVGINTAIRTLIDGYEGLGFAIPASRAKRIATDLAEHGRVRRAFLGVQIGPIDRATADRLDQAGAVMVNGITVGGPASEAGIHPGDVILSIGGKPVKGPGALQAITEFAVIGAPLAVTIDHNGERREVEVRPREQPETFGLPDSPVRPGPAPLHEANLAAPEGNEPALARPEIKEAKP